MNLFNLTTEYLKLQELLEESYGELTPEISEALDVNKENVKEKLQSYHWVIAKIEGESATYVKEVTRLTAEIGKKELAATRMKNTIIEIIKIMGTQEISKTTNLPIYRFDADTVKFSTRRSTKTIAEEGFNDERFIYYRPSLKLKKADLEKVKLALHLENLEVEGDPSLTEIKAAIEEGQVVEKAHIDNNNFSLIIK